MKAPAGPVAGTRLDAAVIPAGGQRDGSMPPDGSRPYYRLACMADVNQILAKRIVWDLCSTSACGA